MAEFPDSQSVSPEWLTRVLHNSGFSGTVTSFSATPIGTGQIGKCIRYQLNYAPDNDQSPDGPDSLIGKFPSDDPASRATGVMLRNFVKEVQFYRHLQSRLTIRTPICYFADIEGEGPDFLVLMEDLTPAQQGDQLLGCDAQTAQAAVMELVGLHAPSWCDESLLSHDWLHNPEAVANDAMREMYRAQLPGFMDRYGDLLTQDQRQIISAVGEATSTPLFDPLGNPFSLVHVDYRLDNLLIDTSSPKPKVTVVDWQSITLGAPLNDVAYFLGAGLMPDLRQQIEEDIVHNYYLELCNKGVNNFSWNDCWLGYRRGTFAGFGVTVVASMLVQRTPRGDQMFTAMARRHAQHAIDLGAEEFLL